MAHVSLPKIKAVLPDDVVLVANGDVRRREDTEKVPAVDSWMIARGAQRNPSVFRKEGPLPVTATVAPDFLRKVRLLIRLPRN